MGQLYVAVADDDRVYAGEDGGPAYNGKGRWRVGEVGEWTSNRILPIAHRDPDTGMIHRGWLEEAEVTYIENSRVKCSKSTKHYETPETLEERRARLKRGGNKEPRMVTVAEPSDAAAAQAEHGGRSVEEQLSGGKSKGKNKVRPANPLDHALTSQRRSDQPVG